MVREQYGTILAIFGGCPVWCLCFLAVTWRWSKNQCHFFPVPIFFQCHLFFCAGPEDGAGGVMRSSAVVGSRRLLLLLLMQGAFSSLYYSDAHRLLPLPLRRPRHCSNVFFTRPTTPTRAIESNNHYSTLRLCLRSTSSEDG